MRRRDPRSAGTVGLLDAAENVGPIVSGLLGIPTEDEGRQMGLLDQAFLAAHASGDRRGMAEAIGQQAALYGPNMLGAGVISSAAAKASRINLNMPNDDVFRNAVNATPGAEVTQDGLKIQIQRSQRPEQELEKSVRGGVFYLPKGDANAKYYTGSGYNFAYGGSQKIEGETLFRNPLFIKGATGGKAPEAALKQLLGKDGFAQMEKDLFLGMGMPGVPDYIREETITNFLEKYAPELSDSAFDIFRNSKKGNQLRYALQEAAAASAARRAGYDGILGYSVRRKTKEPFISEVFDVREEYYPSPTGEFEMWDSMKADP